LQKKNALEHSVPDVSAPKDAHLKPDGFGRAIFAQTKQLVPVVGAAQATAVAPGLAGQ
jgi:hypothetical protein